MTFKKTFIIGEIGINHNGSLTLSKKMMLASKKCGANSVKFQTYSTDDIIVSNTKKANYQIKNTKNNESQYDMLKKYELNFGFPQILQIVLQQQVQPPLRRDLLHFQFLLLSQLRFLKHFCLMH